VNRLETVLATLSEVVDWPEPAEHLATRVVTRIESPPSKRPRIATRHWAWIAVASLVLAVPVIPGTRQAVANLFQEAGVRIGFVEDLPADLGRDLELGERVTIEAAASRVEFDLRYPAVLGRPEETYVDEPGLVSMLWEGPVLLTQRAGGTTYAEKALASATAVMTVDLADGLAQWVEGAEHSFTYLDAEGNTIAETSRLAGNVLLWSADGVDYRLELSGDLGRALDLAESLEVRNG
jgi:hypothetical protein